MEDWDPKTRNNFKKAMRKSRFEAEIKSTWTKEHLAKMAAKREAKAAKLQSHLQAKNTPLPQDEETQMEPPQQLVRQEEMASATGPVTINETQTRMDAENTPTTPPEEKRIRANPMTFGMLSVVLFLCGDCRRCLSYQQIKKGVIKNLLSIPICDRCLQLNGDVRKLYRDAMFQPLDPNQPSTSSA